ncbi:MAG: GatB/YqeY domain-containing protein [Patescibacteria group bacterium]|nr:GatB/YqeY domain-containing protein [Patescibacteria group bacterium]
MSKLNEKFLQDLKEAMRLKDVLRLSVLRMLMTAIKNKQIALVGSGNGDLSEKQIIEVIASEIKKRKDSCLAYENGGRRELADKELEEIKILEEYMPEQMSEEQLKKEIKEIISGLGSSGAKDFGRVMGAVMPKFKGRADGNKVMAIVKDILAK